MSGRSRKKKDTTPAYMQCVNALPKGVRDNYFPLHLSVIVSPAYRNLSAAQKDLLHAFWIHCKRVGYNLESGKGGEVDEEDYHFEESADARGPYVCFPFGNVEKLGIYKYSANFYRDMEKLADVGFIERVYRPPRSEKGTMTVYRPSIRWQSFKGE